MHLARREEFPRKRVREGFLNAEPGSRKEKKKGNLCMADRRGLSGRLPHLPFMQRAHVADHLLGADQEIPDGPTKTTFLGRLKLLLG